MIGQGHPRAMIYKPFVEPLPLMLHATIQNRRLSGFGEEALLNVFAIYSHGGHLGHVTLIFLHEVSFPRINDNYI